MPSIPPDPIITLARSRAEARARRDWQEADRIRQEIESAGWKVVDAGSSFTLTPAHPADVFVDGRTRYGRSESVPSRLDEAPVGLATVVMLAGEDAEATAGAVAVARTHVPPGTALIVVGDAPTVAVERTLVAAESDAGAGGGPPLELILTSERLGPGAAANAGLRRASAPVVVLLGADAVPTGDVVTPLVRALDDPGVAVAGAAGVALRDLRHPAPAGPGDVDALELGCLAFRRDDYRVRGPLDERLRTAAYLGAWWSLVLRDEGPEAMHRRAVAVPHSLLAPRDAAIPPGADPVATAEGRAARRDYYRVLDQFGGRRDLVGATSAAIGREDP